MRIKSNGHWDFSVGYALQQIPHYGEQDEASEQFICENSDLWFDSIKGGASGK